jgi:2-dehydro-3-deoxyphosphogluconate aldolase/(4S)-4-hydroxy-2-oxoglutarate aldolase
MNAEAHVRAGRLIAIIRVPSLTPDSAAALTSVLVEEGVRALEFTLTSRGALEAITAARKVAGDGAAVGAGTVLYEHQVQSVADAGGQFIVSPNVSPAVIRRTNELGLVPLPGAFTPTEIQLAVESGAPLVKLFPAQPAGLSYFRSLQGPLDKVAFVPTGGLGIHDIAPFLSAGAIAVALGSSLVNSADDLDGLRIRAQGAVRAAQSLSSSQPTC